MGSFVFVNLDDGPEPEWQVRVDSIVAFTAASDGVEVILSSGVRLRGSLSLPALMAKMNSALCLMDDGGGA